MFLTYLVMTAPIFSRCLFFSRFLHAYAYATFVFMSDDSMRISQARGDGGKFEKKNKKIEAGV